MTGKLKRKTIIIAVLASAFLIIYICSLFSSIASSFINDLSQEEELIALSEEKEISDDAEAYRDTVTAYANEYDIQKYSDIIIQMINVYLSEHIYDIINASYCTENIKFPHKNEGITEINYSLRCGISNFSKIIKDVKSECSIEPIENQKYLAIALQTYEFQDMEYIVYAKNKGYTPTSASKFKTVSTKPNINYSFASQVLAFGTRDNNASDWQKKIVDIANNFNSYKSICTTPHYCLKFVCDIYEIAQIGGYRIDCAWCSGAAFGVSNDWSKIPLGAAVYGLSGQQYGHVGIYIGNGNVIHNGSGIPGNNVKILKHTGGGFVGIQSLSSFVSQYNCKCWGFNGAHTEQYPCKPEKYMRTNH